MGTVTLDIQQLVHESGVARRTIYFYVQQGILPPPQGAGLAAYYTREHLVRLRLIPFLREQGLRLDSIRERFNRCSAEELETMLNDAVSLQEEAAGTKSAPPRRIAEPTASPAPVRAGSLLRTAERYIYYHLAAGITLVVSENLGAGERGRVQQLLQAAGQIFPLDGPEYTYHVTPKS